MERSLQVSEFVSIINDTLAATIPSVLVEGEIDGYKLWNGRLAFFDLKDDEAVINCMLPVGLQRTPLEDGMQVRLRVEPRLTKKGRFSVNVKTIELIGEGALKRAYELLKAKLESEGLFAPERKRTLPRFPTTIGLVTSTQSAAYRDFLKITDARWGGVEILSAHVQVQGEPASEQIVRAIDYFNGLAEPVDVLVVIRGGGSIEDLAAFNTEPVVRAIAGSRTPTVVGVGHENDISLADLAADLRASTPTDAANLVVPDRRELLTTIDNYQRQLGRSTDRLVQVKEQAFRQIVSGLDRFMQVPRNRVETARNDLSRLMDYRTLVAGEKVQALVRTLRGFDPESVLNRGYAVVRQNGEVVRDTSTLKRGQELMIQLAKGEIDTEVKNVRQSK